MGTDRYRKYVARQDTWAHGLWGYYRHEFVVTQAISAYSIARDVKYPLTLNLHSAGGNGYSPPSGYLNINAKGFYVSPRDEQSMYLDDPSMDVNPAYQPQTFWTGYASAAGGDVTGLSMNSRELLGKRLQAGQEAFPHLTRIAVLFNALSPRQ